MLLSIRFCVRNGLFLNRKRCRCLCHHIASCSTSQNQLCSYLYVAGSANQEFVLEPDLNAISESIRERFPQDSRSLTEFTSRCKEITSRVLSTDEQRYTARAELSKLKRESRQSVLRALCHSAERRTIDWVPGVKVDSLSSFDEHELYRKGLQHDCIPVQLPSLVKSAVLEACGVAYDIVKRPEDSLQVEPEKPGTSALHLVGNSLAAYAAFLAWANVGSKAMKKRGFVSLVSVGDQYQYSGALEQHRVMTFLLLGAENDETMLKSLTNILEERSSNFSSDSDISKSCCAQFSLKTEDGTLARIQCLGDYVSTRIKCRINQGTNARMVYCEVYV